MKQILRILVAAADPAELTGLRGSFPQGHDSWQIGFSDFDQALESVGKEEIDIIFASGGREPLAAVRLLDNVWNRRPETARFVFGTVPTPELMVHCAMGAHHFVGTPSEPAALEEAIQRAQLINRLLQNRNLQSLVSQMRTLPSRPSVHFELMKELRSPHASAEAVGELVAKDFAISTKLIQVVNSAFYGLARQVSDVSDAVLLLGLETTSAIVLSIEAFARFDKVKPLYFSIEEIWRHSQTVAHGARKIAQLMTSDPAIAAEAFTAGLLHDIGKLALALNFEEQYRGAMNLARKTQLAACEVETEVFGASHAEAGAYLLSHWGLPLRVIEAVADHHLSPSRLGKNFTAATALHLAERLQFEKERGQEESARSPIDLDYPPELGLAEHLNDFRKLLRGSSAPSGEGTQFFMRPGKADQPPSVPAANEEPLFIWPWSPGWRKPSAIALAAIAILLLIGMPWILRRAPASSSADAPAFEETTGLADRPRDDAAPGELAALRLQGIMFKGSNSSGIINGKSLHVGEEIEGATLTVIEPTYVVVNKSGATRKIELK